VQQDVLGCLARSSAAFTRNPIWLRALALPTMSMSWVGAVAARWRLGLADDAQVRRLNLGGCGHAKRQSRPFEGGTHGWGLPCPAGWGSEQDEQVIHSVGEHRGDADDDVCGLRAFQATAV